MVSSSAFGINFNFSQPYLKTLSQYNDKIKPSQLAYAALLAVKYKQHITAILLSENIISHRELTLLQAKIFNLEIITYSEEKFYPATNYEHLNEFNKLGYVPVINEKRDKLLVLKDFNLNIIGEILKKYPDYQPVLCQEADFYEIITAIYGEINLYNAKYYLRFLKPRASAYNLKLFKQKFLYFFLFSLSIISFFNYSMLQIFGNIIYLLQNLFKIRLFLSSLLCNISLKYDAPKKLPIYTILIPLYREAGRVEELIIHINNLRYPRSLLDVKLIVEADDVTTIRALQISKIPNFCRIIKVPASFPRTKPKALNFAMPYIKGEFLVIYDAEDNPEPDQLLKAVSAFDRLPKEYACLQARLNFYNSHQNFLTKLFSIEYSLWFDFILRGLVLRDFPVTLSGTSNHLRVEVLKKIGIWDAYNVTEDAELGLRLRLNGYEVQMLDSITFEEAPISIASWITQRTRWIKGFLITFLVYLRQGHSCLTYRQRGAVTIFVCFGSISFLLTPILMLYTLACENLFIRWLWLINTVFSLTFLWAIALVILCIEHDDFFLIPKKFLLTIIIFPFYFWLHSIAAYLAIWELFTKPFKWNKTEHGIYLELK